MLERGGNAFDAAVAAGFVLQVVEPHLNGPGGEVPILLYSAERDEVLVVDGQGTAPAAATIERFRELGHELVPGTGLLAACVPGAFDAWLLLLREFGTMPLADVLEPAIGYAESGYPVVPGICSDDRADGAGLPRRVAGLGRAVPACAEAGQRSFATATWRRPTGVCSPSRAASSRPRATSSTAASSPRRSSQAGSLLDGDDLAAWQASVEQPVARGYQRLGGLQDRAVGPGAGLPAAARAARRLRAAGPRRAGLRPHGRRVRQARLRRPRGVVRRRRRSAGRSAERRPTRTSGAGSSATRPRASCGRAARAAASRGFRTSPSVQADGPGPASRPAATPATSTWSTASATSSRRRRAAAGCTARR